MGRSDVPEREEHGDIEYERHEPVLDDASELEEVAVEERLQRRGEGLREAAS